MDQTSWPFAATCFCPGLTTLVSLAWTTTLVPNGTSTPLTAITKWSVRQEIKLTSEDICRETRWEFPPPVSNRPQNPWYLTAGLTTNITNSLTNDFHYSYLRNYWARASNAQPPRIADLGGAIETLTRKPPTSPGLRPGHAGCASPLLDGQDNMIRDDVSSSKGTHSSSSAAPISTTGTPAAQRQRWRINFDAVYSTKAASEAPTVWT